MDGYPWEDDGKLSSDEFKDLLKNDEHKAVFFKLDDGEKARILIDSSEHNSDIEDTLDKLAKYLDSFFFRTIALSKAEAYGLSAKEADELARIWREREELVHGDD